MVTNGHVNGHSEVDGPRPSSFYLPVSGTPDTFWQTYSDELSDFRSTKELPEHSDIIIVGAGYAGVATAYHLLCDNDPDLQSLKPSSVTILEARGACSGATGRNGGHLRPDLYGHIPKYISRAGVEAGAEIAEFEIDNMYAIKKVVEDLQIDCDFTLSRTIDTWCNEEAARKAEAVYKAMMSHNLDYMKDVFFKTGKAAEGLSGVKGAYACASYTAGTMWPYKFILGLLRRVLQSGRLNLQTHTPVLAVKPDEQHGFAVRTERGTIYAKKIVHASNAYVSCLLPEYENNIIPCKGICCHIDTDHDGGATSPLLNNSYINRTSENVLSYLIPRTDGSIVVGGAAAKFFPHRSQWYRNVDDTTLIEAAKNYYDNYMQDTYQGWEESGAKITKIWTGVMGYSFDSNPHIGAVPEKPGQYIIAGFNGHGMPVIWLSAKGIAKMLLTQNNGTDCTLDFKATGIPRLFQTTSDRIERARKHKAEEGDILGSGSAIPEIQSEITVSVR